MTSPNFVQVLPSDLNFEKRNQSEEAKIKIINISDRRVGFKFFSNRSDECIVIPKSGFIEKNAFANVSVKALDTEKPPASDLVIVVKARVASADEIDREQAWHSMKEADESTVQIVPIEMRNQDEDDEEDDDRFDRIERSIIGRFEKLSNVILLLAINVLVANILLLFILFNQ